jgi:hypothetical protein
VEVGLVERDVPNLPLVRFRPFVTALVAPPGALAVSRSEPLRAREGTARGPLEEVSIAPERKRAMNEQGMTVDTPRLVHNWGLD